jgi:glycosyltransferase involved in cell wall biosynthesis
MQLSVIICTHNPSPDYLERVMDPLKAQTLPKEQWGLLLIDNTSKQPQASSWELLWHPQVRFIPESALGLINARMRGFRKARGQLIVCVDDDNVIVPLEAPFESKNTFILVGEVG